MFLLRCGFRHLKKLGPEFNYKSVSIEIRVHGYNSERVQCYPENRQVHSSST
jgi:hypothetical protein